MTGNPDVRGLSITRLNVGLLQVSAFFLPISISISTIAGMMALAIWLACMNPFRQYRQYASAYWFWPVLAFMLLPFFGLIYTVDIEGGVEYAQKSHYWFYSFLAFSIASTMAARRMLYSFVAGVLAVSAIITLQYFNIIPYTPNKYPGFINSITNSLFIVIAVMAISMFFRSSGRRERFLILGAMLLMIFTLSITRGRAGYLAFMLCSPLIAYNLLGRGRAFLLVPLTCLLLFSIFLSPVARDRVGQILPSVSKYKEGDYMSSVGERLLSWEVAIDIFKDNPLIGAGTGAYGKEMMARKGLDYSHPHSAYFFILACYGILGIAVLAWLLWTLVTHSWKDRMLIEGWFLFSVIIAVMSGSLTGTQIYQGSTAFLLGIATGLNGRKEDTGQLTSDGG